MKQTVEEAAREYSTSYIAVGLYQRSQLYKSFIAGAEWQSKQSPWQSKSRKGGNEMIENLDALSLYSE